MDRDWFGVFVQAIDPDFESTRDYGGEARQAQASFKETDSVGLLQDDAGIDDGMGRDRLAKAFRRVLRRQLFYICCAVFDDCDLQRESDLRSGQPNAGSGV